MPAAAAAGDHRFAVEHPFIFHARDCDPIALTPDKSERLAIAKATERMCAETGSSAISLE